MNATSRDRQPDGFAAVVLTGGSSGIGKSFLSHVLKMCPRAFVCNLSRTAPHRENSSAGGELNPRHVSCDLADPAQIGSAVGTVLEELDLRAPIGPVLLINNAGFGGYGTVDQIDREHQLGMIDVNVRAVVDLTARLLPVLRRRGGAIINVASTAAFQPTSYLSTYGATKAFVLHWSLGLAEELRPDGITVLAVCPGPTSTEFFRRAGVKEGTVPERFGQTSEAVVAEAWRALQKRRSLVVTGWKNRLMAAVSSKLPKTWAARLGALVLRRIRQPSTTST